MTKRFSMLCRLCLAFAFQTTIWAQTITNEPQSITVNNGSDATFTVGASNVLTYQWQFNGSNLTDGENISGSTNAELTLEDVATNQAGNYTVILNNAVTSSNATLTIVPGTIVQFTFSGFIGGGTSNVVVQLFDHDKPATVENFIHYITAGAFSNMFFQRCVPGFVIQGGSYATTDQTNASPLITGWDIAGKFTFNTNESPLFPAQVDSEFNVGPVIHNTFGTMAMSLASGESNSASCGFFFNLADNSGSPYFLDSVSNGPFTVFGRILNNSNELAYSNVLAYFNTLTNGYGIVTNGNFVDDVLLTTNQPFPTQPVDYDGTNAPANSNLVFCGFSFLTTPPVDATPPAVSVTSPVPNTIPIWTNGSSGPLEGTASDNVGLADVFCIAIPQAAADGTYPNGDVAATNYATGTTNWSDAIFGIEAQVYTIDGFSLPYTASGPLPPGSYELMTQSQDGAGNLSPVTSQFLTITAVATNGDGNVSFVEGYGVPTNISPIGYPLQIGTNYTYGLLATPATNYGFINWTAGTRSSADQQVTFDMSYGAFLVANFGPLVPLNLIIVGNGTVSLTNAVNETVSLLTNGEYAAAVGGSFQVTAIPGHDTKLYSWNDGTQIYTNLTQYFTMTSNMTLIVEFVSNTEPRVISFTSPTANDTLYTNSFLLKGTITASVKTAQITCQIFSLSTGLEVMPPLTTNDTNTWSVAVSNLPPGEYEVQAVADYEEGKSTAISEKFKVLLFSGVTGTYDGLFICDNDPVNPTNSGSFTMTVEATGLFTAKLNFPAYSPVSFYSTFPPDGIVGYYTFNEPGNPFYLYLDLDLTNGSDVLTGYVFSQTDGSWVSPLLCYRAVKKLATNTTPATGKYIFSLNSTNAPNTNGYATLSVGSTGVLTLAGLLSDDASISQSTGVSQDGVWPLYAVPVGYKTNGMLMGWETNTASNNCSGQLYWYKASHIGTYYTNGVDTNVTSTGTNYLAPAAGTYLIVFQGGTITVPVTNELTVARTGDQFVISHPIAAERLVISLSTSGVISGHFLNTNDDKTLDFSGAFFGQSQGGSGLIFEGGGQTGYFSLEPQ
jgi:cyclophilin family peptidyl-prolyl cis-trans isomerase